MYSSLIGSPNVGLIYYHSVIKVRVLRKLTDKGDTLAFMAASLYTSDMPVSASPRSWKVMSAKKWRKWPKFIFHLTRLGRVAVVE